MLGLLLFMAEAFNAYSGEKIEGFLESEDYEQALFLTRVNQGLYSEAQLPILDKLVLENPDYLYLKLQVCERLYGFTSREAADVLLSVADYELATFEEPRDLYILLERFKRRADNPEIQLDLLLKQARIAGKIIEWHNSRNLDTYVGPNNNLLAAEDQRMVEVGRAFLIARRSLDEARKLNPDLSRYNAVIDYINSLVE